MKKENENVRENDDILHEVYIVYIYIYILQQIKQINKNKKKLFQRKPCQFDGGIYSTHTHTHIHTHSSTYTKV